ncbi:MAG: uroporphyrinogen-III C-methyltransferase [Rickettsiales bacterium]|jgi:uroporphyrin-III C-methyltransferase / precorrin-2 dehydrogenase / sirohydrochlorin ferrochelatase|nr:uroporphyrinogen-III C-methyltransferase [Rickettsiales bacterium]
MTDSPNNHHDIKSKQYLPVFLATDKNKILLVGGGDIAMAKLSLISDFSENVTIIAKELHGDLRALAQSKNFVVIEAEFAVKQLVGFDIVVAATDDAKVNAEISKYAKQQNILVNVVDNSSLSNFIFGSIVKRDNLTIAISSNGISPVLTRMIKQKIEHFLPMTLGKLTNFIARYREQVKQALTSIQSRRLFWQDVIEGEIAEEVYSGNEQKAGELLEGALHSTEDKQQAALYLVGAGPGDPDLITLKASRLIAKADVILYDRLVSKQLFNFARKEVIKINVGKTKSLHRYHQSEINELIKEYGLKGKIIVRLKGGDTAIFANLTDEIAAAKEVGIPYQIIPGVTAASGAAAYLGMPLTTRDGVRSVRYLTYYKKDLLREDYWQELANSTDSLVFYMSTHHIEEIIDQLIKYGMDSAMPIIAVSQATTPFQSEYLATLADFNDKYAGHKFASPTIVIIGKAVNNYENCAWHESPKEPGMYFDRLEERV